MQSRVTYLNLKGNKMFNLVDFVAIAIIAWSVVSFVAAAVLIPKHIKALKELKAARYYNEQLLHDLASSKFKLAQARSKGAVMDRDRELSQAVVFIADLLQELEVKTLRPLQFLGDDALIAVVREELERRVTHRTLVESVWGTEGGASDPWKIASKVGGAAFRVVDKAKRGKLVSEF